MNIKRMLAYGLYYVVCFNFVFFTLTKLLSYFNGYNLKSIATLNILLIFLILPIHGKLKKIIEKIT